jgi:lysozyme
MSYIDILKPNLNTEEGRIPYAYQDQFGYWTIGVGRLIDRRKGGFLRDDEIDLMLNNDIADRVQSISTWPAWQAVANDDVRAAALLDMAFQLGVAGLAGFHNSLALIANQQWSDAAAELRNSLWAQQTPNRAARVIGMIETGVEP